MTDLTAATATAGGARQPFLTRLFLAAVVALAVMLLAACGGDDEDDDAAAGADETLPVVKIHALEGGTSAAAIRIIEMNGFDEANGFEGEFFEVGGDASVQFFLQGESDVSFDGDPVTAALLRSQGEDVTTFYPLVVQDVELMVRGDSGYQTPQDLIGERVGHDGLESGSMTAAQIMLPEFEDITITEDYNLQLVPEAALPRLLARGDLEAAFLAQPLTLQGEIGEGFRSVWGPGWEEWEEARGGRTWNISLMARDSWIEENPELAEAVTAAWDDAYEWIQEDPDRLTEDPFPELFGLDDPEIIQAFADLVRETEYFTNRWTDEDVQAARDFIQFAADRNLGIEEAPEGSVTQLP